MQSETLRHDENEELTLAAEWGKKTKQNTGIL